MDVLSPTDARIIGCLMEKAVTTPDQYPLSLNALTNACNQKSSRDPVMSLTQGEVQRATRELEDRYLLNRSEGKSGIEKYEQRFCNTVLSDRQFDDAAYAIVTLLLLRGAQTPGELRSRSGRLHNFENNRAVSETLTSLIERDDGPPMVARLPKSAGRQDHEYMHQLSGDLGSVDAEATVVASHVEVQQRQDRIEKLEARVTLLERQLSVFADRLGETLPHGQDT
tara:strand:- start:15435 stop:16109 length:675 start_codon:yes stop_codon:yes gene_type:complete